MATLLVDSAATFVTGLTWADAYTTLAAALAVATASDEIHIANTHNASQTSAKTLTCPATPGLKILSVAPSGASGNSGLSAGAIEACGAGGIPIAVQGCAYIYGLTLLGATNNSSSCLINLAIAATPSALFFDSCSIQSRTANAGGHIVLGARSTSVNDDILVSIKNTEFKFGATGQTFLCQGARIVMSNISINSSGSAPTTLFAGNNDGNGTLLVEASDLSGKAWSNVVNAAWTSAYDILITNCKFPASTALSTGSHTGPGSVNLKIHNCDSGDTQYNYAEFSYAGSVVTETTIVRTGGGAQSHKLNSSANTKFPYLPLTVTGSIYNSDVGSAKTLTIECVADENVSAGQGGGTSNAFTNAELWVEVQHQGTSGFPQSVIDISDRAADVFASSADQASSSVSWTTTGLTTPKKCKLECTFTPQEAGYVQFKICLAMPSKTVYVDVLGVSIS